MNNLPDCFGDSLLFVIPTKVDIKILKSTRGSIISLTRYKNITLRKTIWQSKKGTTDV